MIGYKIFGVQSGVNFISPQSGFPGGGRNNNSDLVSIDS